MATQKYLRLTRDRSTRAISIASHSRSSLWLGEDHLLLVQGSGFNEGYKRFYFRDIQAFTVRQTGRRTGWNLVLGVLLILFVLLGLALAGDMGTGGTIVYMSIFMVILGIPLLVNNLLGQACKCWVQTAVQTEELPSLSRVRRTQKVLARIRPLIAAAQGQFTAAEVAARLQEAATTGPAAVPAAAPVEPAPANPPFGGEPPVST
jgi:hypothetical protein